MLFIVNNCTLRTKNSTSATSSTFTMRCLILLTLGSVALGCLNANTNKCASFIKSQSGTASAFCATFTQNVVTATSALPAWATNCSNKPSLISAECSCHYTGGGNQPVPTSTTLQTSTTTLKPTTTQGGGGGGPTPTGVTTTLPASSGTVASPSPIVISGSFDGGMKKYDRSSKDRSFIF